MKITTTTILALTLTCAAAPLARAQDSTTPPAAGTAAAPTEGTSETAKATAAQDDDDEDVNVAQPDFTIVGLPTTLRMPKGKFAFRVTHRFGRPLGDGDFGDLASDLFGLDSGGLIGMEVRYGLMKGTQVGVLRTSDRTIQFFGQHQVKAQSESFPVGLAVHLTADGTNNFKDSYSPGVALVVSREIGERAAVYVQPTWVNNTNVLPSELTDDNDTVMIGLGGRVRVSRRAYLVGEVAPRVSGFDPGGTHASVGVEMRAGGHAFQINFSRGLATTMGQIARGGSTDDWFIGFNISRKFW
ncbi:MAG TPA: DUF5777 family beta-barrel protein [Luteitalea sp.]|nr:DUF5777 family beta-barrel protein [Luteitalea sp.]